ncbi:MAG: hypothetical protein P4L96_17025, partial [Rhodoferax sp.]|nr:hypothetical protein [Rhodoferax sp.]
MTDTLALPAAVADCTAALMAQPGHVKALMRRADAYFHCEKFEEARADLDAAMGLLAPGPMLTACLNKRREVDVMLK